MTSKMAINSKLSPTESKKQTKQTSRNGIIDMEIIWRGYQRGGDRYGAGIKKHNW